MLVASSMRPELSFMAQSSSTSINIARDEVATRPAAQRAGERPTTAGKFLGCSSWTSCPSASGYVRDLGQPCGAASAWVVPSIQTAVLYSIPDVPGGVAGVYRPWTDEDREVHNAHPGHLVVDDARGLHGRCRIDGMQLRGWPGSGSFGRESGRGQRSAYWHGVTSRL